MVMGSMGNMAEVSGSDVGVGGAPADRESGVWDRGDGGVGGVGDAAGE